MCYTQLGGRLSSRLRSASFDGTKSQLIQRLKIIYLGGGMKTKLWIENVSICIFNLKPLNKKKIHIVANNARSM